MKAYSYKDSGFEALGEAPSHWKTKRLFNICDFIRGNSCFGKNDLLSEGKYVALQYGKTYKVELVNEQFNFYVNDEFYKSSQTVDYGDVIFVSTSETMEDLGHSVFYNRKDIGLIGGEQILLKPKKNVLDGKYLFYASKIFGSELNKFATGIKVFRFDVYDLKTIYINLPPLNEQKIIVDFLDKAIVRIDRIISIKEEQVDSLDSYFTKELTKVVTRGIGQNILQDTACFWLPKIKQGWRLLPLKRLLKTKLKYGANEPALDDNVNHPRYIRITDFDRNGKLRSNTFKSLSPEVADPYLLTEGDVLFARSGATVGKTFIFKDYDGLACFAGYLIKAECDKNKLLPDFLYYFTKSLSYSEWKDLIFTQATIQNIGADKYQYLNVPVPSVEEQNKIVGFIKTLEEATNDAKSNIKSQIDTLQNYRKSLIHECVTGKKQVADRAE